MKFVAALIALVASLLATRAQDFISGATLTNNATRTTGFTAVPFTGNTADLVVKLQGDQAGTGNVTLTFARSHDGTTVETTPRFTRVFALTGNMAVVGYTNLFAANTAARYIVLISAQNADATASATNVTITLVPK